MAYVMSDVVYQLSEPTDYDLISELRVGGNGSYWGAPEVAAGSGPDDLVTGRTTWDSDPMDGFDSYCVPVMLIVTTGETSLMYWSVGDGAVTYLGPTCTNIAELEIRSAVDAQAGIEWTDMELSFFSEGMQVDSWSQATGPVVDQSGDSTPGEQMSIVTVQPESSVVDEVRLTAMVRIWAPEGVYLDANSVFAQVLIRDDTV